MIVENYLKAFNIFHNNKYDYSLSIFVERNIKIDILCPIHGLFQQTPQCHKKSGCQKCNIESGVYYTKKKSLERFISDAKNIL